MICRLLWKAMHRFSNISDTNWPEFVRGLEQRNPAFIQPYLLEENNAYLTALFFRQYTFLHVYAPQLFLYFQTQDFHPKINFLWAVFSFANTCYQNDQEPDNFTMCNQFCEKVLVGEFNPIVSELYVRIVSKRITHFIRQNNLSEAEKYLKKYEDFVKRDYRIHESLKNLINLHILAKKMSLAYFKDDKDLKKMMSSFSNEYGKFVNYINLFIRNVNEKKITGSIALSLFIHLDEEITNHQSAYLVMGRKKIKMENCPQFKIGFELKDNQLIHIPSCFSFKFELMKYLSERIPHEESFLIKMGLLFDNKFLFNGITNLRSIKSIDKVEIFFTFLEFHKKQHFHSLEQNHQIHNILTIYFQILPHISKTNKVQDTVLIMKEIITHLTKFISLTQSKQMVPLLCILAVKFIFGEIKRNHILWSIFREIEASLASIINPLIMNLPKNKKKFTIKDRKIVFDDEQHGMIELDFYWVNERFDCLVLMGKLRDAAEVIKSIKQQLKNMNQISNKEILFQQTKIPGYFWQKQLSIQSHKRIFIDQSVLLYYKYIYTFDGIKTLQSEFTFLPFQKLKSSNQMGIFQTYKRLVNFMLQNLKFGILLAKSPCQAMDHANYCLAIDNHIDSLINHLSGQNPFYFNCYLSSQINQCMIYNYGNWSLKEFESNAVLALEKKPMLFVCLYNFFKVQNSTYLINIINHSKLQDELKICMLELIQKAVQKLMTTQNERDSLQFLYALYKKQHILYQNSDQLAVILPKMQKMIERYSKIQANSFQLIEMKCLHYQICIQSQFTTNLLEKITEAFNLASRGKEEYAYLKWRLSCLLAYYHLSRQSWNLIKKQLVKSEVLKAALKKNHHSFKQIEEMSLRNNFIFSCNYSKNHSEVVQAVQKYCNFMKLQYKQFHHYPSLEYLKAQLQLLDLSAQHLDEPKTHPYIRSQVKKIFMDLKKNGCTYLQYKLVKILEESYTFQAKWDYESVMSF